MNASDLTNGLFELLGGVLLTLNCIRLYRDKMIRGVTWQVSALYAAWGFWNCFYYPHLGQWFSFAGGIVVVSANTVWVAMAVYYSRKESRCA